MVTRCVVKNWQAFQHYKARKPPWIKLHRSILDDREFQCLPLASKALAPMLWLLASESKDGTVICDPDELAWHLRWPVEEIRVGVAALIDKGFLIDASNMLADSSQEVDGDDGVAIPDTDAQPINGSSRKDQAIEVLTFLNARANRAYRPTDANLDFIVCRLKEGATVADCRKVVAKKCREWLGDDHMDKYLRPATLFNKTKFNQYIGEIL